MWLPNFADFTLDNDRQWFKFKKGLEDNQTAKGYKIGTLCVIDRRPKTLLPHHLDALKKLSHQASMILELRLKTRFSDKLLSQ